MLISLKAIENKVMKLINILQILLRAVWLALPAYVANGTPVVVAKVMKLFGLRRHPIDFGKNFIDGRRIFGDSKSWEGFASGIIIGTLTSFLQSLHPIIDSINITVSYGFISSLGAMTGDLMGAFIKRRLGLKPGEPLPIVDQLMFIVVAMMLAISLGLIEITLLDFIFILVITFALHVLTNALAYLIHLKEVPW